MTKNSAKTDARQLSNWRKAGETKPGKKLRRANGGQATIHLLKPNGGVSSGNRAKFLGADKRYLHVVAPGSG